MNKLQVLFAFLVCVTKINTVCSQEKLIPYLANGQYGFADESGAIIVAPQFEEVTGSGYDALWSVKKNGKWSLVTRKGKWIESLSFDLRTTYRNEYGLLVDDIPSKGWTPYGKVSVIEPVLFEVENPATDELYYVNPEHPKSFYEAYQQTNDRVPFMDREADCARTGLLKVTTKEGKVNFLDSTGTAVLSNAVVNGKALGPALLLIANETGKLGLLNLRTDLTPEFEYSKLYETDHPDVFLLSHMANGTFTYIHSDGHQIAKQQYDDVIRVVGDRILINEGYSGKLYNLSGEIVATIPQVNLQLFSANKIKTQSNKGYGYGLVDLNGKMLAEPIFVSLSAFKNGIIGFADEKSGGIMDSNLVVRWKHDSIEVTQPVFSTTGYYQYSRKGKPWNVYGMIDSLGNTILDCQYTYFQFQPEVSLFEVRKVDSVAFFNHRGEIIISFTKGTNAKTKHNAIQIEGGTREYLFSTNGKLIHTKDSWKPELVSSRIENKYYLTNEDGQVLSPGYNYPFQIVEDYTTNRRLYFARVTEVAAQVFDDDAKSVCPDGYVAQLNSRDIGKPGEAGLLLVVNEADTRLKSGSVRQGVINSKGEWVVPPDQQSILRVREEFFSTANIKTGATALYNRHGDIISSKSYSYPMRGNGVGISDNRLVVMYGREELAYLQFMKTILQVNEEWKPDGIIVDKPAMFYGFINAQGEEVIPVQYDMVEEFRDNRAIVTKTDKHGVSMMSVIDTNGTQVIRPYTSLEYLFANEVTYISKDNGKYGLLDSVGNILIPFAFESLTHARADIRVFYATDATNSYLIVPRQDPVKIGGLGEISGNRLASGYFVTTVQHRSSAIAQPETHFFNLKENHHFEMNGKTLMRGPFSEFLPAGYVAVNDISTVKPYVVSLKTGKVYKE
jgi:hypothetical protein